MERTSKVRPNSKAELLDRMRAARADFESVLAAIGDARMMESGATGWWSPRDVIAHLLEYDRFVLNAMLRQQRPPDHWIEPLTFDERNQILYDLHAGRTLDEVRAESRQIFDEMVTEAERLPEAFLLNPQHYNGVPEPLVPWEWIESESYNHYYQHADILREWLAAQ